MITATFHRTCFTSPLYLFQPMRRMYSTAKPIFVTSPIFYVNAVPHIGHMHSTVMADTLRRYYDLRGHTAVLSTGTDEHGLKVQQAASKVASSPREFCDKVSERFKELFDNTDISYTTFIRTTEKRHAEAVNKLWNVLQSKGYIYKGQHDGWYSVSDETFYAPSQVQDAKDENSGETYKVSTETGQRVEWTSEENYKFRLTSFQDKLLKWMESNPHVIVPESRYKEVKGWIERGLTDLSISRPRSRIDWGIPVPGDPDHTIYVWMDALTNYLTVTGYPWSSEVKTKEFGAWPTDVHVVGKDIVRFHAVYWPAILMAADLPLPGQILAHAHWTMFKTKMSKSRGNVVDPLKAVEKYGIDTMRFYLMRDGGLTDDCDYSEDIIQSRYRKDLLGQLGNLVVRCSSKGLNPESVIPQFPGHVVNKEDVELHQRLEDLPTLYEKHMEERDFNNAFGAVFEVIYAANKHFTENAPWLLAKSNDDKARLNTILFYALESTRIAGILLQPVMPRKMTELLDKLGVRASERTFTHARFGNGWPVNGDGKRMLGENIGEVLFPAQKF